MNEVHELYSNGVEGGILFRSGHISFHLFHVARNQAKTTSNGENFLLLYCLWVPRIKVTQRTELKINIVERKQNYTPCRKDCFYTMKTDLCLAEKLLKEVTEKTKGSDGNFGALGRMLKNDSLMMGRDVQKLV